MATTTARKANRPKLNRRGRGGDLYKKVRQHILDQIVELGLAAGDAYSTEAEVAARMNVGRNTARRAMLDLEKQGIISRRPGVGAIVQANPADLHALHAPPAPKLDAVTGRLRTFIQLPDWNDTVDGFYTGNLLKALSNPRLDPPLSIEVRHHDDPITATEARGTAAVIVDPKPMYIPHFRELEKQGVRVILAEAGQRVDDMVTLFSDPRPIVKETVCRLYELGHESVGIINHDPSHLDFLQKQLGFFDGHREAGRPIAPNAIVQWTKRETPTQPPDVRNVTAWICSFLGAVHIVAAACRDEGLSIPEDVSLVSLDNPEDMPVASVGKRVSAATPDAEGAAKIIHDCLHNWREEWRGDLVRLPMQWIEGETIGPPRRR